MLMARRPARNRDQSPKRGWRSVARTALVMAAAAALVACSIEKNYEILSFWFDGVPNPKAKARASASGIGSQPDARSSPTYSAHRPFVEEQCRECHSKSIRLGSGDSHVCLKCHQEKTTQFPRMHGPVAAAACLWCHSPHDSAYPSLLKSDARALCMQCHEEGMLRVERVPAHADAGRRCLECHQGHGGESAGFLRPGVEGASPAAPTP